jgi:predicted GNAT family acetyltransferase
MRVDEHPDAAAFRGAAEAFLERDEAAANPVLGRIERFGHPGGTGVTRGFSVRAGDGLAAAAVETGARGIVLTAGPAEALAALADHLRARGARVDSADGPEPAVMAFAERWCALAGARAHVRMELRLHRLDAVRELPPAPGAMRAAGEDDAPLAAGWMSAFCRETGVPTPPSARAPALVQGRLFLWQPAPGAAPCTMAAWSRPTRRGCSIGAVYTPPSERGRGYATALVAALSRRLLLEGRAFCTLFTDRTNPVSNRIYARIGYLPLADHVHVSFEPPAGGSEDGRRAFPPSGEGDRPGAAIPPAPT